MPLLCQPRLHNHAENRRAGTLYSDTASPIHLPIKTGGGGHMPATPCMHCIKTLVFRPQAEPGLKYRPEPP
ncbi:hypothetical protein GCM10022398_05910 [Acetobacter lovaniensis]|nr:hypothetical protein AA0474_3052 [Acetobacter lovaniensis NRIC 0474]